MSNNHHTSSILKITARAFTNPLFSSKKQLPPSSISIQKYIGGNPVTIFHFSRKHQHPLPCSKLRSHLAKSCSWESVISYSGYQYNSTSRTNANYNSSEIDNFDNKNNRIWFYMPSGEEVSYCAHAAMAACSVIQNFEYDCQNHKESNVVFLSGIIDDEQEQSKSSDCILLENMGRVSVNDTIDHKEVTLTMSSLLNESDVDHEITMKLLDQVGLKQDDILNYVSSKSNKMMMFPSFINSSVARNKTLIPLKSIETLNAAKNPPDAVIFRDLCDEIDSTGLYIYASNSSLSSYECRQFPRYSGYPEDPATGIAAAALANSLYSRGIHESNETHDCNAENSNSIVYEMYQGTAMNKPSKIKIRFDKKLNECESNTTLSCSGIIELDKVETMKIPITFINNNNNI